MGDNIVENVLDITNLVKTYGTRSNLFPALKGINLTVKAGEFMGVMGPSGSGKTTLLNMAATIDRPTSGTIQINGQDIQRMRAADLARFRCNQLGFIFQDYNLLDTLTLRENIGLPLSIAQRSPKEIKARVEEIAATFDLTPQLDKYPYQVSGGQNQRAAAARAMVTHPALVLADEPTGALDTHSARTLLETLDRMNRNLHATILMVTHDANAASYCSQIVFLQDGKIVHQLSRGNQERRAFFENILDVVSAMGERETA
jgi:putative ABC transport system ATP-binding protein